MTNESNSLEAREQPGHALFGAIHVATKDLGHDFTAFVIVSDQCSQADKHMAPLSKGSLFTTFRETFWKSAALDDSSVDAGNNQIAASTSNNSSSPRKVGQQPKALKALDLRALPRDDGPPTELRARRDKFAFFEQQCSEVDPGLYLSSDAVARNWDTLEAAGITHVVNCVGFIYPAYFEDRLKYQILYLQGS